MKPIHVISIALATAIAFGIIWGIQIWSAERWNTALQGGGNGSFYSPVPVDKATNLSRSSGGDRLQKLIDDCRRVIKSVGHRSRLAPPGVYFTLTYLSARNPSGITGLEPGTRVVCVKDEGAVLLVRAGNLEFEANRQYLTDDPDVADLAVRNDAEAQQAVASYIAQQQQAIDQREDKRKMQASGPH